MLRKIFSILFSVFFLLTALSAATRQQIQEMIRQNDYEHALPALRALMQNNANRRDGELNKWFGQALCMTGAYAESIPYLEAGAKANKTGAYWYLGIARQHTWDFEGAVEALETYRSKCSANSVWIPRTDSILDECRLGLRAVQHVQDVVIIDSLQVPAAHFWAHYLPGAESGRLLRSDSLVFENQPGDCRLWASRDSVTGNSQLYQSHAFQGQWEDPVAIPSVGSGRFTIGYPWQRTDGETLYFACDSTPGLGGMDIYMTTYDADTEEYRSPQRLGMPFNSPFNDYMMAIDEQHHIGWWATDRNAEAGMVHIYLFLVEEEPEFLEGPQPERARITSIAETWRQESYASLLEQIYTAPQVVKTEQLLYIPIDDQTVYTSVDQFRSTEARSLYQQAVSLREELENSTQRLEGLRASYHTANSAQRASLANQILPLERHINELLKQVEQTEKLYRNKEITNK